MDPRVDLITLGVPDVAAARRFYVDGLGWRPTLDVPGEVLFLQVGHGLLLSLFGDDALVLDMGLPAGRSPVPGADPDPPVLRTAFTLAHNVESDEEVRTTLAVAERAGGRIIKPAQRAEWGGVHGYFSDPAGFCWEVAHNPGWSVDADGTVQIRPVEPG
jgi:hypothetical protein